MKEISHRSQSIKNEFYACLEQYRSLWDKGLKKQANEYLKTCMKEISENTDKEALDEVLCDFCRRFFDNGEFGYLNDRGNALLPYELNKILWEFLKSGAAMEKMPHMRWIWEIFGVYMNPFDKEEKLDREQLLKKAYEHKDCDEKTVNLYFKLKLHYLGYGAHHFPDRCLFDRKAYMKLLSQAQEIADKHTLSPCLMEEFQYIKRIYNCYIQFDDAGRKGDFRKICLREGFTF